MKEVGSIYSNIQIPTQQDERLTYETEGGGKQMKK